MDLNERYIRCIDENRLDDWPGFFTEDGVYKIIPRENLDDGFPGALLFFDSGAMRRDRVLCIRDVNIYHLHIARHFLSAYAIERRGAAFALKANFQVLHSDNEGRSSLYATGEYRDLIVAGSDGTFLFQEKIVILDTFTIPSQLAEPL
jgi:anthranilate 1,2-dioxygenase small subunit